MTSSLLATQIKNWATELGFIKVGITDIDLSSYENSFQQWLGQNYHGSMHYMERHIEKRFHPEKLLPKTTRAICVAIPYLKTSSQSQKNMGIAYYAQGKDYHRLIRKKLQQLADKIEQNIGPCIYRAFSDSAPIYERGLAEKAGIGWIGNNTNLIHPQIGSYFFLGELLVNLDLPIDQPVPNQCGTCRQCIKQCPTGAILAPHIVDSRRCIAYLTIEHPGIIPEELRPLMGHHIFGCDVCQQSCPWNKNAALTNEPLFTSLSYFRNINLLELFLWTETEFLTYTKHSPIKRLGYERWLRNVVIALGNSSLSPDEVNALKKRYPEVTPLVQAHFPACILR